MLINKRNGAQVDFDREKIVQAIKRANNSVDVSERLGDAVIDEIANTIEHRCQNIGHIPTVEEVQDMVIKDIQRYGAFDLATSYTIYRYQRSLVRAGNTIDKKIFSILEGTNEEARTENSNKNIDIAPVQRDYMAGEVNRDITERILLPKEIIAEHKKGAIHFHDSDFFGQKIHNCALINIDDMLQHGTVITDTKIEKPHSFATACNIMTQIVMQVASCQYGGQTVSLSHVAPFVDISRQKIRKNLLAENEESGTTMNEEQVEKHVQIRLAREIEAGVQTIQYQLLTMMTTNGQTPFVSVAAYLNEADDVARVNGLDPVVLRQDLAMIIEEVLKQRYQGIKNKEGVWISPPFPKILYFLEDDNNKPGTKYWYLTELAAKCSIKRLTPDYISEKQIKEQKINAIGQHDSYPCINKTCA